MWPILISPILKFEEQDLVVIVVIVVLCYIYLNLYVLWLINCRTPGIVAILGSWLITFYTLWQLVELHEAVPGKRFDRYPELGEHAFGPKLGYWIVMPQQTCVQVATTIVYSVTGGKSLKKFFDLLIPSVADVRLTYFILFFSCLQVFISQTPNFNSLKGVSLLAAMMSFWYFSSSSFV